MAARRPALPLLLRAGSRTAARQAARQPSPVSGASHAALAARQPAWAWAWRNHAAPLGASALASKGGVRAYSQPAGSKIWGFEEIQKLSQDPESKVVIVDTREPSELKTTGWIPTAINIPITSNPDSFHIAEDDFEDKFGFARPARDAELVFYCKGGVRSRAAAGLAREAGWRHVGEYPGSWVDWAGRGGKAQR